MNLLTLYDTLWVYEGVSRHKREHGHPAVQLFLCLDGPFRLVFPDGTVESRACIVNALHPRLCDQPGLRIVLVNVEYGTGLAQRLRRRYLSVAPWLALDDAWADDLIARYQAGTWRDNPVLLFAPLLDCDPPPLADDRLAGVLDYLREHAEMPYSASSLARVANLSTSRLMHLFKELMQVPVCRYLQWRRMRLAFRLIGQGKNLTEAALLCGFADLSHFHRMFVRLFGLPPSQIIQKSSFVQVVVH